MSDVPAATPPASAPVLPPPAPVAAEVPSTRSPEELPKARQIVSIDEDGTTFALDEMALREIFHKVPEDMKVAIFSVVGAFRTGKSFVLDLFLRYLRHASHGRMLNPEEPESADVWQS
ncbi:hypothetical protein BBJ28_00016246, partial [Nothophytophthora sp. Chile5]